VFNELQSQSAVTNQTPVKFTAQPTSSSGSLVDSPAYSLQGTFSPVISQLMHTYNTNPPTDELTNAQNQLAQVKDIMVQNVEQILSRGERIELLVDKTDSMASQATAFRRGARTVRRQMWWKNTRILALSVVVAIVSTASSPGHSSSLIIPSQVLIWIIVAQFCGAGLNQCHS
jgi:vesicle-associated membrane protein 7